MLEKDKIKELEEENKRLKKEVNRLEEEKDEIVDEKKKLEKEFEAFKAKHNITVDNLRKAMNIKPNSKDKPKQAGAPKGHKAHTRHIPERIDYIKTHKPCKCPNCSTKLTGTPKKKRSRYITDVKITYSAKTTRHDIYRIYCKICKKYVEPEINNAPPRANLGLNLMLLIMFLKLGLRLSCEKISDYLFTCHDVKLSKGGVIGVLK
jgi:hypothetical protein